MTEQEQRGRQIYLQGTSPSGREITVVLGIQQTQVPSASLACANCHGRTGLGTSEGGVSPSNLTWDSLTRPYEVTAPSGRKHGPYTESSFKRAVTMGLDAAGNELQVAMPRFRLSLDDADDLVTYIKKLGRTLDPGLTDTTIRVATIVPADGPLADTGQAVKAALQAYIDDLNDRGGLYDRRLELRASTALTKAGVKRFIQNENIFAIVSPLIAGAEKDLVPLFEEEEVPVIGPFTYLPQLGFPIKKHIFYLYAGVDDQARALCHFAAKNLASPTVALVVPGQGLASDLPAAVRQRCQALSLKVAPEITLGNDQFNAGQLATQLSGAGAGTVLFLGSATQTVELSGAAAEIGWRPNLLLIGSLEGQEVFDIPASFKGRAFIAYPTLPSDWSQDRLRIFAGIAEHHGLSTKHIASQISAVGAAEILIEGLKRVGKDLSREKLVNQLEGFYGYKTGLTPAITYGPNRRIGALGAYVVLLNTAKRQLEPAGLWIPLD